MHSFDSHSFEETTVCKICAINSPTNGLRAGTPSSVYFVSAILVEKDPIYFRVQNISYTVFGEVKNVEMLKNVRTDKVVSREYS